MYKDIYIYIYVKGYIYPYVFIVENANMEFHLSK
jgi:hypothetical protein